MRDIARAVAKRRSPIAIHFAPILQLKPKLVAGDTEMRVLYNPTYPWYSSIPDNIRSELARIRDAAQLEEFLLSEFTVDFELWIFIDESQTTYEDRNFWRVLNSSRGKVYVVAAGSYGSHTGSAAHSPPKVIPETVRMNLFSSNNGLCLAFSEKDFDDFLQMLTEDLSAWRETIINYASPCCGEYITLGKKCMHPGVVVELTMFISNEVRHLVL